MDMTNWKMEDYELWAGSRLGDNNVQISDNSLIITGHTKDEVMNELMLEPGDRPGDYEVAMCMSRTPVRLAVKGDEIVVECPKAVTE